MRNPIRYSGIILFVVNISLLSGIYLLFADRFLKSAIIESGTEIVGAKVDLEKGTIDLDEFSVALSGLAVTNPNAPMTNIIEAGNITFNLDASALPWKKTIIDEIRVENFFLNTSRTASGAIDGRKLSLDKIDLFDNMTGLGDLSSIELPDPEKLLEQSNLETLTAVDEFTKSIERQRSDLEKQLDALPGEEQLQEYKEQLTKIKKKQKSKNKLLGMLSKGSELKDLQKAIKKDLKTIKTFGKTIKQTQNSLQDSYKNLKSLPEKDLKRLTSQYSLNGDGISNLAGTIFGDQLGNWISEGLSWYQRLAPMLDQLSDVSGNENVSEKKSSVNAGRDLIFPDQHPLPDNLIKLISISTGDTKTGGIKVSGMLKNLTSQPERWGEPLEFDLKSTAELFEQLTVSGIFDHRNKNTFSDSFKLSVAKLSLKQLGNLGDNLSFIPTGGELSLQSVGSITEEKMDINIGLIFSRARFEVSDQRENSDWMKKISSGLAALDKFEIKVSIMGSIDKPELEISAPGLNKLASQIAKQAVSGKLDQFRDQLQLQIAAKTSGALDGIGGQLGEFSAIQDQLDLKQLDFEGLLKGML